MSVYGCTNVCFYAFMKGMQICMCVCYYLIIYGYICTFVRICVYVDMYIFTYVFNEVCMYVALMHLCFVVCMHLNALCMHIW